MNVLYLSLGYTTHDRRFLDLFERSGFTVHWLPLGKSVLEVRDVPENVAKLKLDSSVGSVSGVDDILAAILPLVKPFREMCRSVAPDIVVAGPLQSCGALVAFSGFQPWIAMSWGSDILVDAKTSRGFDALTRFVLQHADAALGDCRAVEDAIRGYAKMTVGELVTFPWGIDLNQFSRRHTAHRVRLSAGWSSTDTVFLCTRSMEPIYAVATLVEAFSGLARRHTDFRLVLLGDGSEYQEIQRQIVTLGVEKHVVAPGRVDNDRAVEFFQNADIYVSPALSDGSSISLLEAMGCSLPVVVTNAYGNQEWVKEGINGWLAEPGDAASMEGAMKRALSSRTDWQAIGDANRKQVECLADWRVNSTQLVQLIRRMVNLERSGTLSS
ncbi:MAG: glycosyltransferase family 4 protein [Pirellulaceae bacterium]